MFISIPGDVEILNEGRSSTGGTFMNFGTVGTNVGTISILGEYIVD